MQQEKENKLKEKEANKAKKAEEKKLNNIKKAEEKDAKKLSRDLKAAEQSQKRAGKGKKQDTVPESQTACDVQLSTIALGAEVVSMGAPSWALEAPRAMPLPLVRTLGFARLHRGHRHLLHTNPCTLQVGGTVQHSILKLARCSNLEVSAMCLMVVGRCSLLALLHRSLLALYDRSLFAQHGMSLLEDLQHSLLKLPCPIVHQQAQRSGHQKF